MSSRAIIILGVVAALAMFGGAYLVDYWEKIHFISGGYRRPLQTGLIIGGIITLLLSYLFASAGTRD
jgi:hypothetical protein